MLLPHAGALRVDDGSDLCRARREPRHGGDRWSISRSRASAAGTAPRLRASTASSRTRATSRPRSPVLRSRRRRRPSARRRRALRRRRRGARSGRAAHRIRHCFAARAVQADRCAGRSLPGAARSAGWSSSATARSALAARGARTSRTSSSPDAQDDRDTARRVAARPRIPLRRRGGFRHCAGRGAGRRDARDRLWARRRARNDPRAGRRAPTGVFFDAQTPQAVAAAVRAFEAARRALLGRRLPRERAALRAGALPRRDRAHRRRSLRRARRVAAAA